MQSKITVRQNARIKSLESILSLVQGACETCRTVTSFKKERDYWKRLYLKLSQDKQTKKQPISKIN